METFRHDDDRVQARPSARDANPGRVPGAGMQRPDPEVPERARRRRFTAQYMNSDVMYKLTRTGLGAR
jgi:hypothetical protein